MTETLTASPWGRRRLAYTIRFNGVDYRDGIYTVFHFDMAPSALSDMEREMKLDTQLMRYLLVHDDPKAGEKFNENEPGDEGEAVVEATTVEGGEATGSAAAAAASVATSDTGPAAEATETPGATEAPATSETTEAPATSETTEAPATGEVAEAAQEAPVEAASAPETVTDPAPEAADEAESGETTEKE